MTEGQVERILKISKKLGIKWNEKEMNFFDFQELVYEKVLEWEEKNGREFHL